MENTKLSFTLTYTLSSEDYDKIKTVTSTAYIIPIFNNVNLGTMKNIETGATAYLGDIANTWGTAFDTSVLSTINPTISISQMIVGLNTVTIDVTDYAKYLTSTTDTSFKTSIKFGVATSVTGNLLAEAGITDEVSVTGSLTKK